MVFKGRDEADEVRRDIFFLTVAAEGFRFGPTTPAKPAGATLLNKNTFVFLSHISTLLTTGSQSDFTAASVNAVTVHYLPSHANTQSSEMYMRAQLAEVEAEADAKAGLTGMVSV
ncbi:hypothetical protein VTO73DRAFT_7362 [Trametes versicolor]